MMANEYGISFKGIKNVHILWFTDTSSQTPPNEGRLGGSVGWASDFGSGHDLAVPEFEPCTRLCADSLEPGARFGFCVSLSLCPSPAHALSLSLSKINI